MAKRRVEETKTVSRECRAGWCAALRHVAYSQSTGVVPISHLVITVCSNDPPDALRTRRGTPAADP
eukprot:4075920-Prymnesium_polylepis.1